MGEVWFANKGLVTIDASLIARLKRAARRDPSKKTRFCLHRNIRDNLHEMVIAVAKGAYLPVHRHPRKTESFHVIEGRFWLLIFDAKGKVIKKFKMGTGRRKEIFLCRLKAGTWHTILPLSKFVVFHEVTKGPFVKRAASRFPSWMPTEKEPEKLREFQKKLTRLCQEGRKA